MSRQATAFFYAEPPFIKAFCKECAERLGLLPFDGEELTWTLYCEAPDCDGVSSFDEARREVERTRERWTASLFDRGLSKEEARQCESQYQAALVNLRKAAFE